MLQLTGYQVDTFWPTFCWIISTRIVRFWPKFWSFLRQSTTKLYVCTLRDFYFSTCVQAAVMLYV